MEADDLMLWRRKRKFTQTQLADMLGVSRKTINSWERGRHRVPVDIHNKLATIVVGKPREETHVCRGMANTRPDLRLYDTDGKYVWEGTEHPRNIMELDTGDIRVKNAPIRIEMLQDPEYLRRLAAFRAGTWKPTPAYIRLNRRKGD